MILVQARKVAELESYGWTLNDNAKDTSRLLNGRPVAMRNIIGDVAMVHPDGTMRPTEYRPTLAREEDFNFGGSFKAQADTDALDHLGMIYQKISRIFTTDESISASPTIKENVKSNLRKVAGAFKR